MCHLFGKENLLDADESTRSVVGRVAIQKTLVAGSVAIAITWLLRNHTRYLRGILVGPFNKRITVVILCRDQLWEWSCSIDIRVKRGDDVLGCGLLFLLGCCRGSRFNRGLSDQSYPTNHRDCGKRRRKDEIVPGFSVWFGSFLHSAPRFLNLSASCI